MAACIVVASGAAWALTDFGPLSAALPPPVAPGSGFAGNVASGWRFAQTDFVDPGYRDPDPAMPTLRGYQASFTAAPLAVGTIAEVIMVQPHSLSQAEAIADLDVAHGGLDAAALGVFNIASAQNFSNNSLTIGGSGQRMTFKFAGQVGANNDE